MKRLNPKNNNIFEFGDQDKNGRVFVKYLGKKYKNGFFMEKWVTKTEFKQLKNAQQIKNILSVDKHIIGRCNDIKSRAKRNSIKFNLTPQYLFKIHVKNCPILGVKLSWGKTINGSAQQNSPSLDRIDPKKGYIEGNVRWLSQLANSMKSNATPEQLKTFAEWVLKN